MIKTYTYKIKPNKSVQRRFEEQVGICRYVYNLGREVREESFKKGVNINYFALSKQLTEAKKDFDWLKQVNSQTLQAVLERLELGYKKFFTDLKKGNKTSKPKWAKKDKWRSLPFKSIKTTFNGFKLPSFGNVKVFNFKVPKGELRTASIIKEADGLYLKIVVREENISQERENQSVCAIDMGVNFFLTTSDGEFVENPKHLFNYLKGLRVENRKLSRMKKGGKDQKSDFDSAFDKYASLLTKDYKDQFKKPDYGKQEKKQQLNENMRKGNVTVVTKQTGNKQTPQVNIAKILDPESNVQIKTVPKEIALQVQQARAKANKTQDELAKLVECKLTSIKDLEMAEGIYDPQLVVKIEKVLNVKFDRSWKKENK